jgi:DNA-binding beta-propeller fold protein YncE
MPSGFVRSFRAMMPAMLGLACACAPLGTGAPRHYLAITHSALNRVSFFDLDSRKVVGALPAQKLPHDLLLSGDQRTLYVVNTGAQCMTTYHLDSPELWRRARAFIRHKQAAASFPPTRYLNPDPVQTLPAAVAEFHLTDPTFPESVGIVHARVHAEAHHACFDCHARSHGGKPFGPVFAEGGRSIVLVHLAYRNIVVLDAATLAVRRRIPLEMSQELMPVEVWLQPGTDVAFVSCRNRIGLSRPGQILVVDLGTGHTLKVIPAGIYPWHLLPDATGRRLFVNNFQSSRISVVDVARRAIVDSITVQNGPSTMLLASGGRRLYVSCFYTHRLLVVNLVSHSVEHSIPVGGNPTSLLIRDDGRRLDVLCGGESEIDSIDLRSNTVVERWPLPSGAYAFLPVDAVSKPKGETP